MAKLPKKPSKKKPLGLLAQDSALTHVTGKSEFIDDRPMFQNELHVGLVLSKYAHADFQFANLAEVKKIPGVVAAFTAQDFPHNVWGTIFQDQPILAAKASQYVGEAIAVIAAETALALEDAKEAVRVDYAKREAILSIDQARKAKSFLGAERKIERGNVDLALKNAPNILEGSIKIAGAEHFYLEPQTALAIPTENGSLEIWSSTQHPTEVQHVVSHALGLDSKNVVVTLKRMGGGFGGKESQSAPIAAYVALVAHKLKRPARIVLTREEDMAITGKRNPFQIEYKVAYSKSGHILALDSKLFSDGGAYADLSTSIMERAMLHSDSAYFIPNMRVVGQVCRTNYHPHTAFRGFGGPKGVVALERIVEEMAHKLSMDPLKIRQLNCYQGAKNLTHYGQKVENNCLPKLFKKLEKSANYQARRLAIKRSNALAIKKGSTEIRGISMTPVKFGISFTTRFLNQGNALINVYRDGSVQVSTGATEMGQGVYRRISQIVAEELGVPLESVRVMPTSTEKNANTSPTAASSGTDINGAAAALACQQIKARLAELVVKLFKIDPKKWASLTAGLGTADEVRVKRFHQEQSLQRASSYSKVRFQGGIVSLGSKTISFVNLCNEAYLNRISLCEYAHYAIPDLGYDKTTGKGKAAFLYFTQGVACSEVSISTLSGETKILRSDILMDLGRPVNPGLDVGQVAGAFVQGFGWLTMEKLFYSKEGALLSLGPSSYKIPAIHDMPRDWNIKLFDNSGSLKSIRGSKAVGEPPLLLAISVWTAIQNALSHLPQYADSNVYPLMNTPADSESILRKIYPNEFQTLENMVNA